MGGTTRIFLVCISVDDLQQDLLMFFNKLQTSSSQYYSQRIREVSSYTNCTGLRPTETNKEEDRNPRIKHNAGKLGVTIGLMFCETVGRLLYYSVTLGRITVSLQCLVNW